MLKISWVCSNLNVGAFQLQAAKEAQDLSLGESKIMANIQAVTVLLNIFFNLVRFSYNTHAEKSVIAAWYVHII